MTTSPTGRLSSSGPSFQQIPVNTPEGQRLREAFRKNRITGFPTRWGKSWTLMQMEFYANEGRWLNEGTFTAPPRFWFDELSYSEKAFSRDNWPVRQLCADIVAGRVKLS